VSIQSDKLLTRVSEHPHSRCFGGTIGEQLLLRVTNHSLIIPKGLEVQMATENVG
jgi:uncharacterized protein YwbE